MKASGKVVTFQMSQRGRVSERNIILSQERVMVPASNDGDNNRIVDGMNFSLETYPQLQNGIATLFSGLYESCYRWLSFRSIIWSEIWRYFIGQLAQERKIHISFLSRQ